MIDLRAGLGAPPIVFASVQMKHPSVPDATPGNAPIMMKNQAAQRALGCVGCAAGPNMARVGTIGDLAPSKLSIVGWPLWAKVALGIGGVGVLVGVGYGVYRIVR